MLCCVGLFGGLYVGQQLGGPWTYIAPAAGFGLGLLGDMKFMHKMHKPAQKKEGGNAKAHIGAKTKVNNILSDYPFIKEYLIHLHPHFKALNNALMMNTVGQIATLDKAANAAGIPVDKFLSGIADEIKNKTGKTVELESSET